MEIKNSYTLQLRYEPHLIGKGRCSQASRFITKIWYAYWRPTLNFLV